MKSKASTLKKSYKKKTMKATWDSEGKSEEDIGTTNVCFMTKNNETTKVRA